jgi:RepB DNA-primase from phage plasmid
MRMDPAIEMKKVEHGGGGVAEASATTAPTPAERIAEALAMVEAFESVGVTLFGVTLTDRDQEPVKYKADRSSVRLREALAAGYLFVCEARQQNLIVRPKPNGARLVQLDDVSRERAEALASLALFTLETSPGNFQLWMAVADISDDQARDLKCALGVDKNASRAARLAGSANVKMKYAPNYPVVRLRTVAPGES